jgi:hypothetical protein
MASSATRRELQTWSRNGFSTRWDAELAREEWDKRRRAYKLRYRLRHPERLAVMQRIYKARWKAKQHGLEPPPLPDWNNVLGSFEIQFARGYLKGQRPPPLFPSCPEMKLLNLEGNTPAPRNPKENKKRTGRSSGEKKPTESIMSRPRYPEVGHVYRRCRVCGRNFRVGKSRSVRQGEGHFCTMQCLGAAWHLFSFALATEQLDPIFKALAAAMKEQEEKAA